MSGTDIAKIFTHGRSQVVRLRLAFRLPPYSWIGNRRFLIDGAKLRAEFVVPHAQDRSFFTASISSLASMPGTGSRPATRARSGRSSAGRIGPVDLIVNPMLDISFRGLGSFDFAP
jgi:hypothetical protein